MANMTEPEQPAAPVGEAVAPVRPRSLPRSRRILFIAVMVLGIGSITLVLAEAVVRQRMPYLLPRRSDYMKENGLPFRSVNLKLKNIKEQKPDYVLIGDSHVESGQIPGGWISSLNQMTGKGFIDLAISGSCPSQYFVLLDRLRTEGITTPVVMVIYIGNDFFDDGLWNSLGDDKSGYLEARGNALNDPSSRQFWPCLDGRFTWGAWFSNHFALYRALSFAKYKVQAKFSGGEKTTTPEENEKALTEMMGARCTKPPHSELIGGRLFFFDEHEAQLDPREPYVGEGMERVRKLILDHCGDANLRLVLVATREETSANFHHRVVTRVQPFIDEMKSRCPSIIDPNAAFAEAAMKEELYLPDSHFNLAGGRVLAGEIKRALGL